jgi:thiamine-phosphate pyrophosphorylase
VTINRHARIVLVTHPAFGDEPIARCVRKAARALPPGWLCVQLRDKGRPLTSLRLFAGQLRRVTREVGAMLVINGDPRLARDVAADGVHLGAGAGTVREARRVCGAGAWVSVAAHTDEDVEAAVADGADGVLVSPVFASRPPTPGAKDKLGRGLDALRAARAIVGACPGVPPETFHRESPPAQRRLDVYALGGVTAARARACIDAGADGVAVLRELLGSAEPARVARAIHDAVARRC